MTGIERLYKLIADIDVSASPELWYILRRGTEGDWDCEEHDGKALDSTLATIADQIQREHSEDREAIAWVREHGGRDEVRMELDNLRGAIKETCARLGVEHTGDLTADAQGIWRAIDRLKSLLGDSVPRAAYERHLARRQRQIDECHEALRRRNVRIEELGNLVGDLTTENAELQKRLMPEGMEWPRYESGEPVNLGDRYECWCGKTHVVSSVSVRKGCSVLNASDEAHTFVVSDGPLTSHGKRVKRPAPKVYDVDGAEIREGDRVWSTNLDEPHEWIVIDPHEDRGDSQTVLVSIGDRIGHARPENLTHRAPVLAADGRPLRVGETVWLTDGSERHVVLSTAEDGIGNIVTEVQAPGAVKVHISPSRLTHQRPDTWQRIEEDAKKYPCDYFGHERKTCDGCPAHSVYGSCKPVMTSDLVRRCKALAEKENRNE